MIRNTFKGYIPPRGSGLTTRNLKLAVMASVHGKSTVIICPYESHRGYLYELLKTICEDLYLNFDLIIPNITLKSVPELRGFRTDYVLVDNAFEKGDVDE